MTTDLVVFTNQSLDGLENYANELWPITDSFNLTSKVWIGVLEEELAEKVIDACQPRGFNFSPMRL